MDVDICGRNSLHVDLWTVTEQVRQVDGSVFLTDIEMRESREHHGVVVLLLAELVLQPHNLEALAANLASVDGTLSDHVEDLLVRVGIIFNTGTHADDDTPRGVGGEDENRVVDGTELRVDGSLHLVPLVELQSILGKRGAERGR